VTPERYNAATLIDSNLESGRAEKIAIYFADERITYRQLFNRVCAMGRALRELGVARENRVILVLDDTPSFPVAFFGTMRIGAVPVPVNPSYKASDYRFFLEDSYARVVITETSCLDKLKIALKDLDGTFTVIATNGAAPEEPDIYQLEDLLASQSGELAPVNTHRDDVAFWLYSSGSTGSPKGVVHRHKDIPATCNTYARHIMRLTERDIVFGRVLFHAYGLGNSLTFPFSAGASSILVAGRPSPGATLHLIKQFRPTVLCLVPTVYNAILNEANATEPTDLSSLRLCISAAEPLAPDIWRRWKEKFGLIILDGIGSTEMLHIFCSNTLEAYKPGSSGRPVPGYALCILDDDERSVAPGNTGNLFVKGESAAAYYWHQDEKSRHTMRGEWTATGDRYRVDEEGFYWYEGRADDMLKVGGEWVSPIDIENTLMEHASVQEAAAVGVPVEGITRIRAVIILARGATGGPELAAELQMFCKYRLQLYEYPHIIDFVDELPKTATGKIQRFKLRMEWLERSNR